MRVILFGGAFLIGILAGCGGIDTHEQVTRPEPASRPADKVLETYVGGTIFKIERTRPLPNAFGGADIFGRKVYAGFTELRFKGLTDDGKILLQITEVETHSTETTMSRAGQSVINGNINPNGQFSGTVIRPPTGTTETLPPDTTQFAFDATKEKDLSIAGKRVHFIEFTPQSLKYSLEK